MGLLENQLIDLILSSLITLMCIPYLIAEPAIEVITERSETFL